VPEHRPDAEVDPRQLRDRALLGGAGRLTRGPRQQCRGQRRVDANVLEHAVVEGRDLCVLAGVPALADGQQRLAGRPQGHEIPGPEQVRRERVGEIELADHEAVADEQRGRVGSGADELRRLPCAGGEPDGGDLESRAGTREQVIAQTLGQIRVEVEQRLAVGRARVPRSGCHGRTSLTRPGTAQARAAARAVRAARAETCIRPMPMRAPGPACSG